MHKLFYKINTFLIMVLDWKLNYEEYYVVLYLFVSNKYYVVMIQ